MERGTTVQMTNSIEIYQSDDGQVQLDIRLEQDTLWLTQSQISELFATSTDNVSLHLKNIYAEQELRESATTEDFLVVRQEGKRHVKRKLKHYNLDAIISMGYRVSSSRAAHLLYFVIKNHPLADGNKRSGSFLFLWYLRINQHLLAKPVEQLTIAPGKVVVLSRKH